MKRTKEMQKGITLVAVVITIIILLVLAGISISALANTGIFENAKKAKEKTAEAEENQKVTLDEYETELNKFLTASDIAKSENKSEIYGKSVEYKPAGVTVDVGWKIFYSDGTNIYLIADNYVERDALPESTKDGEETGHKLNDPKSEYPRAAYFLNILNDYTGSANITNTKLQKLNNSFFSQNFTSTNNNMKAVAYMMDTVAWSKYKDIAGKADYVIGGPTIEMIMDSYNQSYNVQYRTKVIDNEGNVGYQVSKDNGETWQNSCSEMLKGDDLYVIPSKSYTYGMWVASPSAGNNTLLMSVYCSGYVYNNGYNTNSLGFRPLVCLNSSVMLQEENGIYTIQ